MLISGSLEAVEQPSGDSYWLLTPDGVIAGSANTGTIGCLMVAKANAELWAAAPEMYTALKEIIRVYGRDTYLFARAKAAIAKAEGHP